MHIRDFIGRNQVESKQNLNQNEHWKSYQPQNPSAGIALQLAKNNQRAQH
jgi:hypothetical protein